MLKNILTGNVVIGYVFDKISISDYREEFGKEGGRNGGLAEFRLKKRTGFTGSKWCRGD